MPRFYCPLPLSGGAQLALPEAAARHVQVLRLQPGDTLTLFNGQGGEWQARVARMGRSEVWVDVDRHWPLEREATRAVHLLVGMPANERMDWLVEKATELGVAHIQPLLTERTVLRLKGERAQKKVAHWQAVAVAACEQCGRNRVPSVADVMELPVFLRGLPAPGSDGVQRWVLSLRDGAQSALGRLQAGPATAVPAPVWLATGPEGGFAPVEEDALLAAGFAPTTLGPTVLRSETAALSALALAVAQ